MTSAPLIDFAASGCRSPAGAGVDLVFISCAFTMLRFLGMAGSRRVLGRDAVAVRRTGHPNACVMSGRSIPVVVVLT